ncbi:MAG: hypothetical protein MUO77_05270 [Anaerolineales bacterium]|nr:hypothetical protein [Anaerolineales bacterium]
MAESTLPVYVLKRFADGLRAQVGMDTLKAVFEKACRAMGKKECEFKIITGVKS